MLPTHNLPYEKVGKNEPVCIADEVPFEIPESWEWVRLSDLVAIYTGKKDANWGTPNGAYDFFTCSNEPIKSSTYSYDGEYLIMPGNGANIGLVIYYNGKFEAYQRTYLLENINHINLNYLKYHLEFNWKTYNADKMYGSAIPYIKLGNLQDYLVAFPPVNEQARIVDEIERYLPLVNSYEEKEMELASLNQKFPDILKKSILQQAVMGKLVPQDENDEPASVLLQRIRTEKQALTKAGKLKKDKHESTIYRRDNSHYEKLDGVERCIDDEIPFEIPASWEWCRVKDIVIKEIKRGKSPQYANSGRNYVFAQKCNVKTGGIDMTLAKFLSDATFEKYPRDEYMLDEDIVINSTGNGTLGRIGIFHDSDRIGVGEVVPDSHVTVIRKSQHISTMYVFYVLKYYQPYLEKQGEGSTNQTELKPTIISDLLFPLPPYNEQQQIAERIAQSFTSMTALS